MKLTAPMALAGVVLVAMMTAVPARAQQAPAAAPPAPARPALTPVQMAKLNEVLATVNGEKITRAQVLQFLSQFQIPAGGEQDAYEQAVERLVSTRLLNQFLKKNGAKVEPKEVDAVVESEKKSMAANNTSLETALAESGMSYDQMKDSIVERLLWKKYLDATATDPRLEQYLKANLDAFNGTQVKASHIQLNLADNATAADKAAAKAKLAGIKQEIESGKITFPDAANKYSEDPTNKEQPTGGDLRYFPRKKFTEPFSVVAFALKPGQISDPVETEYGMHLIQVTDRKPGGQVDLKRYKEKILYQFAMDEQTRIVDEMRKTAKIDAQPMPKDLFGTPAPVPAATPAPAPGAAPSEPAKPKR